MLECSLPPTHPLCALGKTTLVNAAREIWPQCIPWERSHFFSGAGFLQRTEMSLHIHIPSFMPIHRHTFPDVHNMWLVHLQWGRGHSMVIFSGPAKELYMEVWLPGAVSKPCLSALDPQQNGTETGKQCCSPQHSSFSGVKNRESL